MQYSEVVLKKKQQRRHETNNLKLVLENMSWSIGFQKLGGSGFTAPVGKLKIFIK